MSPKPDIRGSMNKPITPPQDDVAGPRGRHKTTQVMVGNVAVGGGAPIVVQSMTNTDTPDVEGTTIRSEEHTSELQSRQYLVCRLLLEKKKKIGRPCDLADY